MEAKQETSEQIQINKLNQEVNRLKSMVDALCSTNFLTEHQDGDEEVRKWAVGQINRHNRKVVDEYKAKMEHNELWLKQRELRDRMMHLEQDYPNLRDNYEVRPPIHEQAEKQRRLQEYMTRQYQAQIDKAGK